MKAHYDIYIKSFYNFLFVRNIEHKRKDKTSKEIKYIPFTRVTSVNFLICSVSLFIAPIYTTFCLFFYLIYANLYHYKDTNKLKKIYINSMNRINNYIDKELIKKEDYILNFPYKCRLKNYNLINIFNITTPLDIIRTYRDSLYCYAILIQKVGINGAFYSMTAPKYFILYYALKSLSKGSEIVFSNQKDRWALLFSSFENLQKTLIQHGTCISKGRPPKFLDKYVTYNPEDDLYYQNIPYKLKDINTIYAFSQLEAKYMILAEHEKQASIIHIIGYNLTTLIETNEDTSSVLIVGHYKQFSNEEIALLEFFKNKSVHVILKTHPLVGKKPYLPLMRKYKFDLIEGNYFPKVDFLLSYSSTLALEYEAIGVPVIYYDDIRLANNKLNIETLKKKMSPLINETENIFNKKADPLY